MGFSIQIDRLKANLWHASDPMLILINQSTDTNTIQSEEPCVGGQLHITVYYFQPDETHFDYVSHNYVSPLVSQLAQARMLKHLLFIIISGIKVVRDATHVLGGLWLFS